MRILPSEGLPFFLEQFFVHLALSAAPLTFSPVSFYAETGHAVFRELLCTDPIAARASAPRGARESAAGFFSAHPRAIRGAPPPPIPKIFASFVQCPGAWETAFQRSTADDASVSRAHS